jgi:hypothetical protein
LYNELEDPNASTVSVQTATTSSDAKNPFHERMVELVDGTKDPWKSFSSLVASEIPRRIANLQNKIEQW